MSQTVGFHLSELVAALGGEWRGEDVQIKAVAPLEPLVMVISLFWPIPNIASNWPLVALRR